MQPENMTPEETQEVTNAALQELANLKNVSDQRCVQLAADNKLLRMRLEKLQPKKE